MLHKHDSDMDVDADGSFSFEIGPVPDIAAIVTRDYQLDAGSGRPVTWHIEALEEPDPIRHGDEETAAALRASAAWLRTMFMIIPLTIGVRAEEQQTEGHEIANAANTMGPPYQVPDSNFGWSARDACYSFGSYDLAEDEALVITHRPPHRALLEMCVWNQYMANHSAGDGRTSVNVASAVPNSRRHRDGRDQPRPVGAPERADHDGLPARQPGVPLVPAGLGAGAARGVAGEAGRTPRPP